MGRYRVGDFIRWKTIGGKVYCGIIIEMDSNVAHVNIGKKIITVEL